MALVIRNRPISALRALVLCTALGGLAFVVDAADVKEKVPKGVDLMTEAGQATLEASTLGRKHRASALIFPAQHLNLRFSHKIHVAADLTCVECHDDGTLTGPGITKSVRSGDLSLPLEETCFNCHDVEEGAAADPPSACSTCHPGYAPEFPKGVDHTETRKATTFPPKLQILEPHLKMNHKAHVDLGIGCDACHEGVENVDLATVANSLPTMGTCLACHDGSSHTFKKKGKEVAVVAPAECATCHITQPDGRLKTDLPGGVLMPEGWYFGDAHDDAWLKGHALVSSTDEQSCQNCHTPQDCLDCHNGVSKPLKIHPNNWILTHPISSRRSDPGCASCHKSQTFCTDCHTTMGVGGDDGFYGRTNPKLQFHPDGWNTSRGDMNHHAWQAQRNIRACASCHTEATCLQCHAGTGAGGWGINPHPMGFKGANCRRMKRMNPRVCVKCHLPTSAQYQCQ